MKKTILLMMTLLSMLSNVSSQDKDISIKTVEVSEMVIIAKKGGPVNQHSMAFTMCMKKSDYYKVYDGNSPHKNLVNQHISQSIVNANKAMEREYEKGNRPCTVGLNYGGSNYLIFDLRCLTKYENSLTENTQLDVNQLNVNNIEQMKQEIARHKKKINNLIYIVRHICEQNSQLCPQNINLTELSEN